MGLGTLTCAYASAGVVFLSVPAPKVSLTPPDPGLTTRAEWSRPMTGNPETDTGRDLRDGRTLATSLPAAAARTAEMRNHRYGLRVARHRLGLARRRATIPAV